MYGVWGPGSSCLKLKPLISGGRRLIVDPRNSMQCMVKAFEPDLLCVVGDLRVKGPLRPAGKCRSPNYAEASGHCFVGRKYG